MKDLKENEDSDTIVYIIMYAIPILSIIAVGLIINELIKLNYL